MAEYIGSRISLVSKRDIRYVGTLHEINSETSTVALENVKSFGTEDRRPDEVVPASDNIYDYIVFRGSDVIDLRIEEAAPPKENKPPQVPDDPAILGSVRRPESSNTQAPANISQPQKQAPPQEQPQPQSTQPLQQPLHQPQPPNQTNQQQQRQPQVPHFQQHPPFPYPAYGPPPNQRFSPYGFPPGPGFPGMPYGAPPPGWGYPPPGQGFPQGPPRQFYPPQMPIGSSGPQPHSQGQSTQQATPAASADKAPNEVIQQPLADKPAATVKLPSISSTPAPGAGSQVPSGPPPPTESKPDVAAALAPPVATAASTSNNVAAQTPNPPRSGRIVPAIPLRSPMAKPAAPAVNGTSQPKVNGVASIVQGATKPTAPRPGITTNPSLDAGDHEATAAVAAAMAKIVAPLAKQKQQPEGDKPVDIPAKKVNDLRSNENNRHPKQPGTGVHQASSRGGRGGSRGGRFTNEAAKKIEVPATDYDFTTANAKFNKQDLVKEAIASGSPIEATVQDIPNGSSVNGSRKNSESFAIPPAPGYNKTSSFFDNISSESKDRLEGTTGGGREFRSEEQRRNLETFGQGSIDSGYRGGYRGRGRGRGYGRSRGGHTGRGGYAGRGRGSRGAAPVNSQ